jgi:hypothetical protein
MLHEARPDLSMWLVYPLIVGDDAINGRIPDAAIRNLRMQTAATISMPTHQTAPSASSAFRFVLILGLVNARPHTPDAEHRSARTTRHQACNSDGWPDWSNGALPSVT